MVNLVIDWKEFFKRHDLIWETLPEGWNEAAFLGNGLMGSTVYKQSENRMVWKLGRTDVTEHRYDDNPLYGKRRLPIGDLVLYTAGRIQTGNMRLDLWNAEVTGNLITEKGEISFRSFIHTDKMLLVIEVEASGGEIDCAWNFEAELTTCPERIYTKLPEGPPNPSPERELAGAVNVVVQPLLAGGEYATAWQNVKHMGIGKCLFLSIGSTYPMEGGKQDAINAVNQGIISGINYLEETHRQWWHNFYPQSFLSIPDTRLESLYWIQLYKLAAATRADRPAIDLMGPWYKESPWMILWWNLNIQLTYWPVYVSNHLELGESFCRMLDRNLENLVLNVPEKYRQDSAAIGRTSGYDCLHDDLVGREMSSLPFACHNYWLQYRYSMDKDMLRDRLFPLLRRSINFYLHHMWEDSKGIYHLPVGISPEYPEEAVDCNVDLALFVWGCTTLLQICELLKIKDPLMNKWKEVLEKIAGYPKDENGLMIGKDVPFRESHRHYSHLFPIYPLYLINWEQPENRELIEKSLDHWTSMTEFFEGYSYTGAASICSSIDRPNEAVDFLNKFLESRIEPNTLYQEMGPCIETPLSAAKSIQDMLLQSWGDKIRIFPGVPSNWEDVSFYNLRAEGGFLVSASKKDGQVQFVGIKSLAGEPCRIKTPIKAPFKILGKGPINYSLIDGEIIEMELLKGEEVLILQEMYKGDGIISAVRAQEGKCNFYGSNAMSK